MRRPPIRRDFARERDGSMMVELALLFPILVMLLLGVVDFASAANRQMVLEGAVGIGAQLAVARQPTVGSLSEIEVAVATAAAADRRSDGQAVEVVRFCERLDGTAIDCGATSDERAVYVSIRVAETFALMGPYPIIGASVSLTAANTVRIQ